MKREEHGDKDPDEGREGLTEKQQEHRREGRGRVRGLQYCGQHRPSDEVAGSGRVQQQEEKVLVVAETDAVVDPWAVVVHLQNAGATNPAVVATVGLILRAPLALPPISRLLPLLGVKHCRIRHSSSLVLLHVLPAGVLLLVWNGPRMHQNAPDVADHQQARHDIEDDHLDQDCGSVLPGLPARHTVEAHVDVVEDEDEAGDEGDGQELPGLAEALRLCCGRIASCGLHRGGKPPRPAFPTVGHDLAALRATV
mmetsp:Transcript_77636/g.225296  ORF Transcript_77636/g.225296 Transcript_77636/m.225296 type:complete len:253 (-) Transcript_77636:31-789(-)